MHLNPKREVKVKPYEILIISDDFGIGRLELAATCFTPVNISQDGLIFESQKPC